MLAQELHKPVIKKIKRIKGYARYINNIQAGGLAEMASLSTKNGIVKYLLCVINVFSKYAWVNHRPLSIKKLKQFFMVFIKQ